MVLVDRFDRKIGNVRISLTDRCNLRCTYCMPEDGIEWLDKSEILSFEEILRIISIFYNEGVGKFRLTGGEPLVRNDITNLIDMIKSKFTDIDLAMTTNGITLDKMAELLKKAGLNRVNISLDTLDHEKYNEITRRDRLDKVINGIEKSIEVGLEVKINAVSIKSFNDDLETLQSFVNFSEKYGIEVRFIEVMPFTGNDWMESKFVSSQSLRDTISSAENLTPLPMHQKASTSTSWKLRDGKAKIGFISSVSESFCNNCNRLRITSDGKLRPCLHNAKEYDLKHALRSGKSDKEIIEIIKEGLDKKWKEHPNFLEMKYSNPIEDREMIRIGG